MSHAYNPKSCNALEKPFYRPVEAAIRWCELISHEAQILSKLGGDFIPKTGQFPDWPCLQVNTEKILDAIRNDNIPRGRDGKTVAKDDHVAPARITVRHTDLKEWMAKTYPNQKPAFLFDEVERNTHSAINAETYRTLKAAHDAKEIKLTLINARIQEIEAEKREVEMERDGLRRMVDKMSTPSERSGTTYLNIIGGLLELMLSDSPAGKPQSLFKNQSAIISALLAHHENKPGISARTLEEKFAAANRSLSAT